MRFFIPVALAQDGTGGAAVDPRATTSAPADAATSTGAADAGSGGAVPQATTSAAAPRATSTAPLVTAPVPGPATSPPAQTSTSVLAGAPSTTAPGTDAPAGPGLMVQALVLAPVLLAAAALAAGGILIYKFWGKGNAERKEKNEGPRCLNLKEFMEEKLREMTDLEGQLQSFAKGKAEEKLGEAVQGTAAGDVLLKLNRGREEYERLKRLYEECMAGTGGRAVTLTYFAHGTTPDNENGISSGWSDVGLSELGRRQAAELREQLKDKKFDAVFCSDLKRAVDSAKLMFGEDAKIVTDPRLRECNYGERNGQPASIVEPLFESSVSEKMPGGESCEDVRARVAGFLDSVKKDHAGKNVAIVAHKAPQLALDVLLNKKTWPQAFAEDWRKRKEWRPGWQYVAE